MTGSKHVTWPPELAQTGTLHRFSRRLVTFEYSKPSNTSGANMILWVGGLGDGLLTVGYPTPLAHQLPAGWGLAQVMLASSYNGFGTSSLARDAKELGQCVQYFRERKPEGSKVVLMGHSTGCQGAMEYLVGADYEQRPKIDGVILQASVSDREGMLMNMPKEDYDKAVSYAQEMVSTGRKDDVIPSSVGITTFGRVPVTAYRWLSLLSPNKDGDDDYFSSDLPDEKLKRTFGSFKRDNPVLFLFSEADQHVPYYIDKHALVSKWTQAIKDGGGAVDETNGGVLPGAHHNLDQDDASVILELCRRVIGFIDRLDRGDFDAKLHL